MHQPTFMSRGEQLAWCAGFLDGEGSFGSYKESSPTAKLRFRVQAAQVDPAPLHRLQETLGGNVRGPYGPYSGNRQAYYQWQVQGEGAFRAVEDLLPYLSPQKSNQAVAAIELLEETQ